MKTEPCPECGYWSEKSEDGTCITGHYDKKRWLTEPDCETCKKSHEARMVSLGEQTRRKFDDEFWKALKDAPVLPEWIDLRPPETSTVGPLVSEINVYPGTWEDIEREIAAQSLFIYSKTPPAEPGWYWVCDMNDEPHCEILGRCHGDKWEFPGVSGLMLVDTVIRLGIQFGPRVSSAEELARRTNEQTDNRD